jgi:alkylated DNA repair dioxygenase AlkB
MTRRLRGWRWPSLMHSSWAVSPQPSSIMRTAQPSLFEPRPSLPAGFKYRTDLLTAAEEQELLAAFAGLPFREFEFQGYLGKRRVVSFGWRYDFNDRELRKGDDLPAFLLPCRERAAQFAGIRSADLQQVLLTEYSAGAGIGWHKDKAMFGEVVGISLASPCVFRLRRKTGTTWQRAWIVAEPRSAYLLQGPARSEWEHSIPAVDRLRYSITFRNFKAE